MNLIYSGQNKPIKGRAIFLAGCSPRPGQTLTWRKDAIEYFKKVRYKGTVIIPEPEDGEPWPDYLSVVEWEDKYLRLADVVVFWIPRSTDNGIYGFTSNVEFGKYLNSGKIIYGRPEGSDNNRYLDYWYTKLYKYQPFDSLEGLIKATTNHSFLYEGLNVEVVHHYAETDPEQMGDSVCDLAVNGEFVYYNQDYYHNKVESKIEGFLDCLSHLKIQYQLTERSVSDCTLLND